MARREVTNVCGGPYGALYDFYIERPWLARVICRTILGVKVAPLYESMKALAGLDDGATVLDVPCGGGVALRGLRPGQRVRYIGGDISEAMLERFARRADSRTLTIEPLLADMRDLPLSDETADLCLSYSGLHMVPDPALALAEILRCLKMGGQLIVATFLAEGSRRQRLQLEWSRRRGASGTPPSLADMRRWLGDAGVSDPTVSSERGFAVFAGRKIAS